MKKIYFDNYIHDKNSLRGKDHFSSSMINNWSKFMNVWRHKSLCTFSMLKMEAEIVFLIVFRTSHLVLERSRSVTARTIVSAGKRNQQDTWHTWPEFLLVPLCTYVRTGRVSNRNWATVTRSYLAHVWTRPEANFFQSTNRIFRRCVSCQ